ncbi:MAG: helical membrane plugin domain-containing protein [Thermoplasmataceae archaeon]
MENDMDKLEPVLRELLDDRDFLESLVNIIRHMKGAGIVDLVNNISTDYLPTDIEFLGKFFSSKEFVYGSLKTAISLVSVLYAFSDEKTSDLFKAIMYNLPSATEEIITSSKQTGRMSVRKLLSRMKDPEIGAGMEIAFTLLKFLGSVSKKVEER